MTTKANETQARQYAVIAGDLTTFKTKLAEFENANTVHEKHFSTQFAVIPNPNGKILGANGQPELVETVIVSALLIFTPKENVQH